MKVEDLKIKQIVRLKNDFLINGNGLHYIVDEKYLEMIKPYAESMTLECEDVDSIQYISEALNK